MKTYDEFTDFIDSRIESCEDALVKECAQFKAIRKENRELTTKLQELEVEGEEKVLLEKYFITTFQINAAQKPAIYVQGFRDALKLFLKIGLI